MEFHFSHYLTDIRYPTPNAFNAAAGGSE